MMLQSELRAKMDTLVMMKFLPPRACLVTSLYPSHSKFIILTLINLT